MNTSSNTSVPSNANTRSARDGAQRTDAHTLRREGDRFERLLRDKSAAHDEDNDDTLPMTPAPECSAQPQCLVSSGTTPQQAVQAAVQRAGAAAGDTPSSTQAALGSSLASQHPVNTAAGANDATHTFEVSLNEPMGLPLELRAVRVPAAQNTAAPALWALNIAAPSRDAAQLSRHGARLDERLRARGIDPAHVRIEGDRDDDEEQP